MYVTVALGKHGLYVTVALLKSVYVTVMGIQPRSCHLDPCDGNVFRRLDTGHPTRSMTMSDKILPRPDLIRRVPPGFGWVDHRFVREGHIRGLSRESLALYLFLVTVANADGISWYSEEKLCLLAGLDAESLSSARRELSSLSLLAYSRPVYQVLELPCRPRQDGVAAVLPVRDGDVLRDASFSRRLDGTHSIGDILALMAKGGAQ